MTNQTIVHRITDGVTGTEVINLFKQAMSSNNDVYSEEDIERLSNAYAKNPTDNFVVYSSDLENLIAQGDILLNHESSKFFKDVEPSFRLQNETQSRNLQEVDGGGITGDHAISGIDNEDLKITLGTYVPSDNITKGGSMNCKIIEAKKPFVITHKEHGNIACPAGKYMARTQINANNMRIMLD